MNVPKVRLNNRVEIPQLGFGTWKLQDGEEAYNAVKWALEIGYRHIDTAHIYRNEQSIGRAIKDSSIKREDIFVTTKLFNTQHGNPQKAIDESLQKLGLDHIDLYLIHWPVSLMRNRTWGKLEEFLKQGKTRAIGVSNYTIRHLDELLKKSKVIPAVNQVEFHPFLYQIELLEYCKSKGIALEAYSPLTHARELEDSSITEIAKKYGKSNAQIMIRWSLQLGNIVIPKAAQKEHIKENFGVFDFVLKEEDIETLSFLNENERTCWDPTNMP